MYIKSFVSDNLKVFFHTTENFLSRNLKIFRSLNLKFLCYLGHVFLRNF